MRSSKRSIQKYQTHFFLIPRLKNDSANEKLRMIWCVQCSSGARVGILIRIRVSLAGWCYLKSRPTRFGCTHTFASRMMDRFTVTDRMVSARENQVSRLRFIYVRGARRGICYKPTRCIIRTHSCVFVCVSPYAYTFLSFILYAPKAFVLKSFSKSTKFPIYYVSWYWFNFRIT